MISPGRGKKGKKQNIINHHLVLLIGFLNGGGSLFAHETVYDSFIYLNLVS